MSESDDDEIFDDGVIEYEGHDVPKNITPDKKSVDQPYASPSGTLTENGKFYNAAENYKEGKREPAKIKVYRKIRPGVWVDMGLYNLIDGYTRSDGTRNVFKFLLDPTFEEIEENAERNYQINIAIIDAYGGRKIKRSKKKNRRKGRKTRKL